MSAQKWSLPRYLGCSPETAASPSYPAVPQSHGGKTAAFPRADAGQDAAMDIKHLDYALLSELAMAAADDAESLEECQSHLARAVRFASLACMERQRSPDFNVVEFRQRH
jgi:hypothetical protein